MRVLRYLPIMAFIFIAGCVGGSQVIQASVSYDCIKCQTRDTEIRAVIDFGQEISFTDIGVVITNVDSNKQADYYYCYPENRTGMQQVMVASSYECLIKTESIPKEGNYEFRFDVYDHSEGKGLVASGSFQVFIEDSGLPPAMLKGKKVYDMLEPVDNPFIFTDKFVYLVEEASTIKVEACKDGLCRTFDYPAPEGKKFVIIHYGIVLDEQDIRQIESTTGKKFDCPDVQADELVSGVIAGFARAGVCAIPLTISVTQATSQTVINFINSEAFQALFRLPAGMIRISSILFGTAMETSYDMVLMDTFDQTYYLYFPRTENNETITVYSETPTKPLVFAIDADEEPTYLLGRKVKKGVVLFLFPVRDVDILFGIKLSKSG